jgi:hypothetical protein
MWGFESFKFSVIECAEVENPIVAIVAARSAVPNIVALNVVFMFTVLKCDRGAFPPIMN